MNVGSYFTENMRTFVSGYLRSCWSLAKLYHTQEGVFYLISRNLEDGVLKNSATPRVLTHLSMCAGIGISKELLIISEAISNSGRSVLSDIQKPRRRVKKNSAAPGFFTHLSMCAGYQKEHFFACLIYYINNGGKKNLCPSTRPYRRRP